MGKLRTIQICLSDIPPERIFKHPNGKEYISLTSYDYDGTNDRDEDFSVMLSYNTEEQHRKKQGEKVKRVYIGHGKIWD